MNKDQFTELVVEVIWSLCASQTGELCYAI